MIMSQCVKISVFQCHYFATVDLDTLFTHIRLHVEKHTGQHEVCISAQLVDGDHMKHIYRLSHTSLKSGGASLLFFSPFLFTMV